MRLSLKNIGKIGEASVQIEGITVIAGENDTGKSTVGRALFSVFNSFYAIDEQIKLERIQSIERMIDVIYRNVSNRLPHSVEFFSEEVVETLVEQADLFKTDTDLVKEEIVKSIGIHDDRVEKILTDINFEVIALRIKELLCVPDEDIFKSVLEKKLNGEFCGQINNIYSGTQAGEIRLQIKGEDINIILMENGVVDVSSNVSLHMEAVYLDDPFVLDEPRYPFSRYNSNSADHRMHLKSKLLYGKKDINVVEELVVNNKFANIYAKIASVCNGDFVRHKPTRFGYRRKNSEETLDVRNLSTGLKTFAILKILLQNGMIEYNGTIILDEPEIHLHPEWQLLFAELIVLLQKEFSMHILLNTHSPYFLRAIQVYSAIHEVADQCRYYLAEKIGDYANISDVTDDVEKIYYKLSRPLQKLEEERWQND